MNRICENCKKSIELEDGYKVVSLKRVGSAYFPIINEPDKYYHQRCKIELN